MAEIAKATDWQNHSIRGFISGNLTKKMGLKVGSTKGEDGERRYPDSRLMHASLQRPLGNGRPF